MLLKANYATVLHSNLLGHDSNLFMAKASELVAKGQQKYDKGDRMGALNLWEQALKNVMLHFPQLSLNSPGIWRAIS